MKEQSIQVVVRCRPLSQREAESGDDEFVVCEGNKVLVRDPENHKSTKEFAFDKVFWSASKSHPSYADQKDVFDGFGAALVDSSIEGYNCTIFAYGQTGSGKSYSMVGSDTDAEHRGLLPRLLSRLFKSGDTNARRTIDVSMIEIYNERVYDLLDPGVLQSTSGRHNSQSLKVRIHPKTGAYVENLNLLGAASLGEAMRLVELGSKARTIHATNMNATSSRAHTVFTVHLCQKTRKNKEEVEIVSKINLVDLAGSERTNKVGTSGQRLREGTSINKSLSALGKCISALAALSSATSSGTKRKERLHVPYRESTLTLILRESLGGNSRTGMLATISPSAKNVEETLSTLRFASRTKRIVNKAEVNIDPTKKLVLELREEIRMLKKALQAHGGNKKAESLAGAPSALADQVVQNQRIVDDLSNSWENRHQATLTHLNTAKKNMRAMGLVRASSESAAGPANQLLLNMPGAPENEVPGHRPTLVNLNADPMLSGQLVFHILPGETRVGGQGPSEEEGPRFIVSGLGIQPNYAIITCSLGSNEPVSLTLARCSDKAAVHVNGVKLGSGARRIFHNDRIIFGSYSAFRVDSPSAVRDGDKIGEQNMSKEGAVEVDWNFAFREYSKTQMDSLLVAKEQELEKKYRDLFERKLEESNAHIESALEKQCKSLVELQESIAQNERREVQALMDQFDNLREEHQKIQNGLLQYSSKDSLANASDSLSKAYPELRTPKRQSWYSAQEAKSVLISDIQERIAAIKASMDGDGAQESISRRVEEDLTKFVETSLKAMEEWHVIRSQESKALSDSKNTAGNESESTLEPVKENLVSSFDKAVEGEGSGHLSADQPSAREVVKEILAEIVTQAVLGLEGGEGEGDVGGESTIEERRTDDLSEAFWQELTDSILLVESTNGLVDEVNDKLRFKLRLASALPEYGNSVPSGASASGEGEGEEHSIVVDAFFEGNPVGTYSNTDFEEMAAIIEQIYFAATQDDDAQTLMSLHASLLEGLPMDKLVGASYVYLKPLLYLLETDGNARILDEFGDKCGDLSVRIAPVEFTDEGMRSLGMDILDSADLLGKTLRISVESDLFEAASVDLRGLTLFADYRMPHAHLGREEGGVAGENGGEAREGSEEQGEDPPSEQEEEEEESGESFGPPAIETNRFDIDLVDDTMCCYHRHRKTHTFVSMGKEVVDYFEHGALRINVYSKSIKDQALIGEELDRLRTKLVPEVDGSPARGDKGRGLGGGSPDWDSPVSEENATDANGVLAEDFLPNQGTEEVIGIPVSNNFVEGGRAGGEERASSGKSCGCTIQ